jgi:hypothetical protein
MTNSEFSNLFETFYLQVVKQSEQSEVRMSQSGLMALRRAELEHTGHTGIGWLSLKPNCTQTIFFECKTKE